MREQILRVDAILRRFSDFIAPRPVARGEVDFSELVLKALDVVGHELAQAPGADRAGRSSRGCRCAARS